MSSGLKKKIHLFLKVVNIHPYIFISSIIKFSTSGIVRFYPFVQFCQSVVTRSFPLLPRLRGVALNYRKTMVAKEAF